MNKKILITSIMILLITVLLSVNVFAASITSATVAITSSKNEYESYETVEFTVRIKDLNASSGILGLGAYLDYDSNLLTLNTNLTGLSEWSDAEISTKTNRFATTKNSHSDNDEDIIKITFTAKDVSNDTQTSIGLKKIEISNGSEYVIDEVRSNSITIKPKSNSPQNPPVEDPSKPENPTNPSTPGDTNTDKPNDSDTPNNNNNNNTTQPGITDNNNGNNNNNNSNNTSTNNSNLENNDNNDKSNNNLPNNKPDSFIPQLGVNNILPIIIAIICIIATILFIKFKKIDKKVKNGNFLDENDKK